LSDRLTKQISTELQQLDLLLLTYRDLLRKVMDSDPDLIERAALAALLHSFYNGVENILRRIALESDGPQLRGESWHAELLDAMSSQVAGRSSVIPRPLRERLQEYLEFRHFFRSSYSFQLQWDKMRPLVLGLEQTVADLKNSLTPYSNPLNSD
jgi:hypothetical protein